MSIFSRLRSGGRTSANDVARAVITPAVSTMIADGSIANAENDQLINMCRLSPLFRGFSGKEFSAIIVGIIDEIERSGHEATIAGAATTLTPALRETAFCFAARMAGADGKIEEGELASLQQTALHMEIASEAMGKILDVVAMMQRGPGA